MTSMRALPAIRALGFVVSTILAASTATAQEFGTLTITSDTALIDNQFGAVVFGADNITLDCQGHQIYLASETTQNCGSSGAQRCGIVAVGRSNIRIMNCYIMGAFDYGAYIAQTNNASLEWTQSYATTGYRFEGNTNLRATALDANDCALGGYELRNNVNTRIYWTWAHDVNGDAFDENFGTSTDYYGDTRAIRSGVNGFECDSCLDIMYGYPGTAHAGLAAHSNGQHGISIDDSRSVYVWHGSVHWNGEDGVRFQNVRNAPGYHFSDFYVSSSFSNGGCDCRSEDSPGDRWDIDDCGSWCGNFWD